MIVSLTPSPLPPAGEGDKVRFACFALAKRLVACLFPVLLWGCAELPLPPDEPEAAPRPQATAADAGSAFRLAGRIGVSHNGENFSGSLRWRHDAEGDEIFILSPLGQGIARIVRDTAGVSLETAEGRGYRGPDVESLTEEVLGWRLPARGLPYWVAGRPAPGSPADADLDDNLQLSRLSQDGWRVDYQGYRLVQGVLLPARLELSLDKNLRVRLVIDDWVLP